MSKCAHGIDSFQVCLICNPPAVKRTQMLALKKADAQRTLCPEKHDFDFDVIGGPCRRCGYRYTVMLGIERPVSQEFDEEIRAKARSNLASWDAAKPGDDRTVVAYCQKNPHCVAGRDHVGDCYVGTQPADVAKAREAALAASGNDTGGFNFYHRENILKAVRHVLGNGSLAQEVLHAIFDGEPK